MHIGVAKLGSLSSIFRLGIERFENVRYNLDTGKVLSTGFLSFCDIISLTILPLKCSL